MSSTSISALRAIIGKWFFMSSLTGRYTGSPETILETDMRELNQADKIESGFVGYLDSIVLHSLLKITGRLAFPNTGFLKCI